MSAAAAPRRVRTNYETRAALSKKESVDQRMREAYGRWKDAFLTQGLETTPAYDVVGLLAVLSTRRVSWSVVPVPETFFDVNRGVPEQEGCDVYRLKEEFRSKHTLSEFFRDQSAYRGCKLLVITDFGEECDDEVACLLASRLHGFVVRFLFTTSPERYQEQKAKFRDWGGDDASVCSIYENSDVIDWLNRADGEGERPVVLQIGPIHEPESVGGWRQVWRPDITSSIDYVVVGTFRKPAALNVKADAKDAALHLKRKAVNAVVVDTMGGLGAFKFAAAELKALELAPGVVDHVCKIGWRNSVGRANPAGGHFVVHLVSAPVGHFQGGANYMTALGIDTSMGGNVVDRERSARAVSIATKYLQKLTEAQGGKHGVRRVRGVDENGERTETEFAGDA